MTLLEAEILWIDERHLGDAGKSELYELLKHSFDSFLILFVSTANSHTIPRAGASSRMLPLFFCACFFSFAPHEIVHSENSRYPLPRLKTQGSEEQNIAQQLGAAHRAFRSKNTA